MSKQRILHKQVIYPKIFTTCKKIFCALGGTRTHNLIVRTDVLYPLSYEGKSFALFTFASFRSRRRTKKTYFQPIFYYIKGHEHNRGV